MGGPTCLHWELKQQWPHKEDMLCARRWIEAGPAGRVRCWQVQCREPKTGYGKRFNSTYEDDPLCRSRYIIYLWASLIVPDFYNFCVRQFMKFSRFLVSISLIFVHYLFLGIPYCLGDAIKLKEKSKKRDWDRKRKTYMNCQTQKL